MNSSLSLVKALDSATIVAVFDALFAQTHGARLCGGAAEPLYEPGSGGDVAKIHFRSDYAASALHEVAHWCIAGPRRRSQLDYGYWYNADGRDADAQSAFMHAEARPQALEWYFSVASGLRFRLSLDNLDAPPDPGMTRAFAEAVFTEASHLRARGLPPRAASFFEALAARRAVELSAATLAFSLEELF
jgi:elongation factor P hydroxylase